jgi:serine/threonine-protein kinase RsbW
MLETLPQQHIELSSTPENLAVVESLVEQLQETYSLNTDIVGNILVSLSEAVNNAILHGNKSDTNKTVTIEYIEQPNRLAFIITDEGPGFDFINIPDPTAPENLTKLTGRGVFLMRQLADKVEYADEGRTVHLEFAI